MATLHDTIIHYASFKVAILHIKVGQHYAFAIGMPYIDSFFYR